MGIQDRKEREREELRRKIIYTASELVSKGGHENLTIRKLAHAIEYSPRTIYLYFRDKEHLLREIVEEGFRRTLEARRQGQAEPNADNAGGAHRGETPLETVDRRLRAHIDSALSDPHFYRAVVTILFEKSFEPGPAQKEIIAETRKEIAALLPPERRSDPEGAGGAAGGAAGETAGPATGEAAGYSMIIFSTIRGFALSLLNLEDKLTKAQIDELIETYIAFVKQGLIGGKE